MGLYIKRLVFFRQPTKYNLSHKNSKSQHQDSQKIYIYCEVINIHYNQSKGFPFVLYLMNIPHMKHSSFFSSKRSALALGLTLGASALFA
ncbi:hypothetical protein SAMN05216324_10934 [Chryseobacterium limigenitum]|uniref:Uncharacterized protein n=1 Tax=Chryseobacterium limigenitum TaxID=1612149 RepID=A0A1K2IS66_9FLAO|nr:hypothetical protein SAMN05216324_10934 [Chryseobacterium limigenitum]